VTASRHDKEDTIMTLHRIGAGCGLLFAALLFGAEAIGAKQVAVAALVLFVPFAAYLADVLREGGWIATAVFGAALVDVTIKLGSGAAALAAENTAEGSALDTALHDMNNASFILTMYPLAVVAGGAAYVGLRTGALPRWLGWFGAAASAALVVNGSFLGSENGIGFVAFLAWVLAASVTMLVRTRTIRAAAPEPLAV
jgi:Domain of unknown function (DUF4386)